MKPPTITILDKPCDPEIKRANLPILIEATCPQCGAQIQRCCYDEYLSYPTLNEPIKVSMYHCIEKQGRHVEHEFEVTIKIGLTAEVVS
jgi:hypothetical protein